jgi:hypothetical protein
VLNDPFNACDSVKYIVVVGKLELYPSSAPALSN